MNTYETAAQQTRALVIHPRLKLPPASGGAGELRDPEARLEEAIGLALAIELDVVGSEVMTVNRPRPSTLIGGGQIERLGPMMEGLEIDVLVVDAALTPIQHRNL